MKFLFSYLPFIFLLEKLVILIGSRAPIVSCATHFTIFSKKPVFWYLGPFSEAFLGLIISRSHLYFVLEKLVILIGRRAPIAIVSCATHFTILSKKSVFWYVGTFSGAFFVAKYFFVLAGEWCWHPL